MTHLGATLPLAERAKVHREAYASLVNKVVADGLMKAHDRSFFGNAVVVFSCQVFDVWFALVAISGIWSAIPAGILWGITSGWTGQLGHDAGHGQAPRRSKILRNISQLTIGNLAIGFSKDWWITKHNIHHESPNLLGVDPDPNTPVPLYVEQARERGYDADSFVVRWASIIFPAILPLQAMNARRSSVVHLFSRKSCKLSPANRVIEGILILAHVALYATLVVAIAHNAGVGAAITFVLVHQGTHGVYNAFVFATNHKGKDVFLPGEATWLELQILTSGNVRSEGVVAEKVITWIYGGLNYQIEHHLFPKMSRRNLSKVRPYVIEFCRQNGFDYDEQGIIDCYKRVWRCFSTVRLELLESPMGAT